MRLKFIYLSFFLLIFPCFCLAESIHWVDYDKGMSLAKEENKPVFLHFFTDWCGYCRKMERETFEKEDVIAALNGHFISIKVNADQYQDLVRKYGVRGLPDNRFLDQNGNFIYRVPGYMEPLVFSFFMDYVTTGAYKNMSVKEYYQVQKRK